MFDSANLWGNGQHVYFYIIYLFFIKADERAKKGQKIPIIWLQEFSAPFFPGSAIKKSTCLTPFLTLKIFIKHI